MQNCVQALSISDSNFRPRGGIFFVLLLLLLLLLLFFFFFEKQVGQFVSVIGLKKLENGGQLFVDRSIKFPSRPVHGGCVRGSIVLSATLIEPTKKDGMFLVTFLSWLDMKGMLPAAMISMYRHKTAERIDLLRFVFSGKTLDDDSD
jgi:hypothetical protein